MTKISSILFVDDDQEILHLAGELLPIIEPSFKVNCTRSAIEALEGLSQQTFDIVISDYDMPLVDGLEFLENLRNEGNNSPFILLTGRGREEVAMKALNLGANYYVTKGDNLSHLFAELTHIARTLIRQRRIERAKERSQKKIRRLARHYRLLLDKMPNGFALYEIILDQERNPVDYRLLEINHTFEELTGLKRAKIIGKKFTEVLSQFEAPWVEMYGRVVLTGEPAKFETYLRDQNRYCEIVAFKPATGQIATLLTDITLRIRAERELAREEEKLDRIAQKLTTRLQNNILSIQELAVSLQVSSNPVYAQEINERAKNMMELLSYSWLEEDKET
ncbi:MAG: response regulator [Candidatus Hodarchaeota archaeon]